MRQLLCDWDYAESKHEVARPSWPAAWFCVGHTVGSDCKVLGVARGLCADIGSLSVRRVRTENIKVIVYTCNPSNTWGLVQGHPQLHDETLSQGRKSGCSRGGIDLSGAETELV